jgi:hypothetical protein
MLMPPLLVFAIHHAPFEEFANNLREADAALVSDIRDLIEGFLV